MCPPVRVVLVVREVRSVPLIRSRQRKTLGLIGPTPPTWPSPTTVPWPRPYLAALVLRAVGLGVAVALLRRFPLVRRRVPRFSLRPLLVAGLLLVLLLPWLLHRWHLYPVRRAAGIATATALVLALVPFAPVPIRLEWGGWQCRTLR